MNRYIIILSVLFGLLPIGTSAYYTTSGQNIISIETGEIVQLRGFGIGGWLLPEGYMWGSSGPNRPWQFEQEIETLIGKRSARKFWKRYHQNFMTHEDVRIMKSWGVNTLRIPLLASLLQPRTGQPESPPFKYSDYGFAILDSLVAWCEQEHMGIIWDMHGAPGAQNAENIADSE